MPLSNEAEMIFEALTNPEGDLKPVGDLSYSEVRYTELDAPDPQFVNWIKQRQWSGTTNGDFVTIVENRIPFVDGGGIARAGKQPLEVV